LQSSTPAPVAARSSLIISALIAKLCLLYVKHLPLHQRNEEM
jgi:hypothetical protein